MTKYLRIGEGLNFISGVAVALSLHTHKLFLEIVVHCMLLGIGWLIGAVALAAGSAIWRRSSS